MFNDDTHKTLTKENIAMAKRKLKLDLNLPNGAKRQRATASLNPVLTSPDLNMLKLASPELDQLVLMQDMGSQPLFNRAANDQEEFAKGFAETLEQIHHQHPTQATAVTSGHVITTSASYTQLPVMSQQHKTELLIKEEPGGLGGSPPVTRSVSPINMEDQERIKLERKRLRNRIAASKCRRRKLEKIGRLEEKVNGLKGENNELQTVVNRLRDQVCALKKEVMEHVHYGCQIPFVTSS